MASILESIKKMLGIGENYEHFDAEIIMHINSVFMILTQLGLGPETGFRITDREDTWDLFLEDRIDLEAIKSYIFMKVRLMFDPPQMGYLVDSLVKQCTEFEWRLNVQIESSLTEKLAEGKRRERARIEGEAADRRRISDSAFARRRRQRNEPAEP